MRYEIEQRENVWIVIDTLAGASIATCRREYQAKQLIERLNRRPDPQPGEWLLAEARRREDVEPILKKGFEPFAVDNDIIFFRKQMPPGVRRQ